MTSQPHHYQALEQRAVQAISALEDSLLCGGCNRPFSRARPWRSKLCEHTLCAGCAAVARGKLGEKASARVTAAAGKCPVPSCGVPIRPGELAEDVAVRAVVDASAKLAVWAGQRQQ